MYSHLMTADLNDLRSNLEEAQDLLDQAIRLIEIYARETNDTEAEHYLIAPLRIIAHRDHGYLTSDLNLDDLLDRVAETDQAGDNEATDDANDWAAQCSGNMTWNSELRRYVAVPTYQN